ncbi:MAG TPA: dihydrodipicolinate synthase family protein [Actinomycetota bacterium]|jgi:4-hydroxy-tetrahydrodipicolinate synthase|nr:dihydrodipicolinate synthase family protein [Actinomycetota bacterium]
MEAPAGIVCALATPFRGDGAVDEPALRELVDFQAERGVDALFVLGTTGEGVLLDAGERRRATEVAAEHLRGRLPLVVHCGAADTLTAAALARHAGEAGAVASAAVVPYFFRHGDAELYRHFAALAEAAPGLGHYVYENPERVGYAAGVGLVARLVDRVPGILGVKDTGDSVGKLGRYLASPGTPIQVYTGSNLTVLPALVMGARGAVSALANAAPELLAAINRAWRDGDLERARRLQLVLTRLQDCLAGLPYIAAIKYLVGRRGLPAGHSRPPLSTLDAEQAATLDRRLAVHEDLGPWLGAP